MSKKRLEVFCKNSKAASDFRENLQGSPWCVKFPVCSPIKACHTCRLLQRLALCLISCAPCRVFFISFSQNNAEMMLNDKTKTFAVCSAADKKAIFISAS